MSKATKQRSRNHNTTAVGNFCRSYGMKLESLNNGYQLRIEDVLDVYPTNGRYCILKTGERGGWESKADLKQLMLRALPEASNVRVTPPEGARPDLNWEGVEKVAIKSDGYIQPRPPFTPSPYQASILENVKVTSIEQYNKWYRRAWRWLRRSR